MTSVWDEVCSRVDVVILGFLMCLFTVPYFLGLLVMLNLALNSNMTNIQYGIAIIILVILTVSYSVLSYLIDNYSQKNTTPKEKDKYFYIKKP